MVKRKKYSRKRRNRSKRRNYSKRRVTRRKRKSRTKKRYKRGGSAAGAGAEGTPFTNMTPDGTQLVDQFDFSLRNTDDENVNLAEFYQKLGDHKITLNFRVKFVSGIGSETGNRISNKYLWLLAEAFYDLSSFPTSLTILRVSSSNLCSLLIFIYFYIILAYFSI